MRRQLIAMTIGGLTGAVLAFLFHPASVIADSSSPQPPTPEQPRRALTEAPETTRSNVVTAGESILLPNPLDLRAQRAQHLSRFGRQSIAPKDMEDRYREPEVRKAMTEYFTNLDGAAPDVNCDYYPCIVVGLVPNINDDDKQVDGYPHAKFLSISRDSATNGMYRVSMYLPASPMEGNATNNLDIRRIRLRSMEMTMNSTRSDSP